MNEILFTVQKCQKGSEFEYTIHTQSKLARDEHRLCWAGQCNKEDLFDTMADLTDYYNNYHTPKCGVVFDVE